RGLEQVDRHRLDYHDAAKNQTRAKMMREVAAGWDSPVPDLSAGDGIPGMFDDPAMGGAATIERKLQSIVIPHMEFHDARLVDVVEFLSQKSQELDTSEAEPSRRGVNIVID